MIRKPADGLNQVENTIHAAAFAALGFQVGVHAKERATTGEIQRVFVLKEHSLTRPGMSCCALNHSIGNGTLAKLDPTHPILDAIRALRNRESLLRWMKSGVGQHLRQEEGCDRWRLVDGFSRVTPEGSEVFQVSDIGVACGLMTCGIEMVHFDGCEGARRFSFAPTSFLIRAEPPFLDTRGILEAFREPKWRDENPDHPVVLGWRACDAYKQILASFRNNPAVFLEDVVRHSGKTAELPANPTNAQMDEAYAFFKR